MSNEVVVPTGEDQPVPDERQWLQVVKEITNPPALGYYQLNETVKYKITVTNVGDTTVEEAVVHDWVLGMPDVEIGAIELLQPNDSRVFFYQHTVNENDVARTYVDNVAYADCSFMNGGSGVYTSNVVRAWTNEIQLPPDTPMKLPGEGECCERILNGLGIDSAEYTIHLCTHHLAVAQAADELIAKGDWDGAREKWTEALNAMYDVCYASATTGEAVAAVLEEKAAFYAQVGLAASALNATTEERLAGMIDMIKDRAIDMCYEIHTAPKARVDSYSGDHAQLDALQSRGKNCARVSTVVDAANARCRQTLCDAQAAIEQAVQQTTKAAGAEEELAQAWKRAAALWKTSLNAETVKSMAAAADDEARGMLMAQRMMFDNWVTCRERFLTMVYGDNSIAAEVVAKTVMNRAIDLCGATK